MLYNILRLCHYDTENMSLTDVKSWLESNNCIIGPINANAYMSVAVKFNGKLYEYVDVFGCSPTANEADVDYLLRAGCYLACYVLIKNHAIVDVKTDYNNMAWQLRVKIAGLPTPLIISNFINVSKTEIMEFGAERFIMKLFAQVPHNEVRYTLPDNKLHQLAEELIEML